MGDNDLAEFPPHIGKFEYLEVVGQIVIFNLHLTVVGV